jgi:hypothetical protein
VSVKEQVLQAINRLPDDIDYRDAADEIAFLAAVREAERDIEQGRVVSNEQMKARIAEWSDWDRATWPVKPRGVDGYQLYGGRCRKQRAHLGSRALQLGMAVTVERCEKQPRYNGQENSLERCLRSVRRPGVLERTHRACYDSV